MDRRSQIFPDNDVITLTMFQILLGFLFLFHDVSRWPESVHC